jgi:HSP20 family protein
MTLVRYEPWNLFENLQHDVNRLLSATPSRIANEDDSSVATSRWTPTVDIREETDRFVIHADVPGVDPKDIEVTMDRGVLAIRGTRTKPDETPETGYARAERIHGTFYRRFSLPDTADADRIEAVGNHGVLEIVIPKREEVQPKRILVN